MSLNDNDIQQFSRFVREFVVMSLIPWMEKCVIEWNESVRNAVSFGWFLRRQSSLS